MLVLPQPPSGIAPSTRQHEARPLPVPSGYTTIAPPRPAEVTAAFICVPLTMFCMVIVQP